jgi:hypothetical protein
MDQEKPENQSTDQGKKINKRRSASGGEAERHRLGIKKIRRCKNFDVLAEDFTPRGCSWGLVGPVTCQLDEPPGRYTGWGSDYQ